jgi:exonuclease III
VCGRRLHPGKIYSAEKAQENNSQRCKTGRLKREKDYDLRMKVGSWNVRTMLQAGKMAEIADELLKYNLDITALQEVRWKGYGSIKKPRYILSYSGAEMQGEQGVGFLIKRSLEHCTIDFEPINSRLCKVRIKGKLYSIIPQ